MPDERPRTSRKMPSRMKASLYVNSASLLAQPLSYGHPIHTEVLCEIDFGHTVGVSRDGDIGRRTHCFREAGARVGQIAGSSFQFVHVYDYTRHVYSSQQLRSSLPCRRLRECRACGQPPSHDRRPRRGQEGLGYPAADPMPKRPRAAARGQTRRPPAVRASARDLIAEGRPWQAMRVAAEEALRQTAAADARSCAGDRASPVLRAERPWPNCPQRHSKLRSRQPQRVLVERRPACKIGIYWHGPTSDCEATWWSAE